MSVRQTSFRIRKSQAERLHRSNGANAVINYAIRRFRRGDFQVDHSDDSVKGEELVVCPFYGETRDLNSHEVRLVLDAHFTTNDEYLDAEIIKARQFAEQEWAKVRAKGPAIITRAD